MDFEVAFWQMLYLVVSPARVYRNLYHHKQAKSHWARDDPAFHLIIAFSMSISAIAYGVAYGVSLLGCLKLIFFTIGIEFLFAGSLMASLTWYITNTFMLQQTPHSVEQSVEWMYCFDVHCNAFVPFFLVTYIIQFFFLGIVTKDGFFNRIFGNTIYLIACVYYTYITFLGFKALPFLKNAWIFIYLIVITFGFYVFSIFSFNISQTIFAIYFE
ncbi:UNC-50 [Globomyces pollinis-pini]|nr:UNC-50 [Globomyces pollinis-pini]